MDKQYVVAFLIALLVGSEASVLARSESLPKSSIRTNEYWESLSDQAGTNEIVDTSVELLRLFIITLGLDPMDLSDIIEGFEFEFSKQTDGPLDGSGYNRLWTFATPKKYFLINYNAWLRLNNGHASGLHSVTRSGNQFLSYFANMLRARLQLRFTNVQFMYIYLVIIMSNGLDGEIHGTVSQFDVYFDFIVDLNNNEIQLQALLLLNVGQLRVNLSGNPMFDWMLTPVVNIFVDIFHNTVISVIESKVRSSMQDAIDDLNIQIKELMLRFVQ